jgi:hypothetical protein
VQKLFVNRENTIVTTLPQFLRNVIQIAKEQMDVLNILSKRSTRETVKASPGQQT